MDMFEMQLNEILVDTFRTILTVEEQAVRITGRSDLSMSEMHLLEAVGKQHDKSMTISDLAQELGIKLPSVTVAINKLVQKEYVEKKKYGNDGRMVFVTLTKLGYKTDCAHQYFHEQMVRNISKEMSEDEKTILLKGMNRLNSFFRRKSTDLEAK